MQCNKTILIVKYLFFSVYTYIWTISLFAHPRSSFYLSYCDIYNISIETSSFLHHYYSLYLSYFLLWFFFCQIDILLTDDMEKEN